MRLVDADHLIGLVNGATILGDGFKQAFTAIVNGEPTIEPERKKGRWNFIGDQMFECTECGTCYTQSQFHQMRVRITDSEFPKFCPNCGTDMREGEQK